MQKKFLRTFAISVFFIGVLGPIGITNAYGGYTEDFEREVEGGGLYYWVCQKREKIPARKAYKGTPSYEYEIGKSHTPMGVVSHTKTHYGQPQFEFIPETQPPCPTCGRKLFDYEIMTAPSVTFKWEGPLKLLVLTWPQKKGHTRICGKPPLSTQMKYLWEKARLNESSERDFAAVLNRLWNAAKIEDSKNPTILDNLPDDANETTPLSDTPLDQTGFNVAHEYRNSSECCCSLL